jgi:hypothetical protein
VIAYNLACRKGHEFEGWFANSAAFDSQEAEGVLSCPFCGDGGIRKAIMAPSVKESATKAKGRDDAAAAPKDERRHYVANMRKFVEDNAENVGRQFPEEVRKIHYGEVEPRHIYGESTLAEARELIEEGIDIMPLPSDPDELN